MALFTAFAASRRRVLLAAVALGIPFLARSFARAQDDLDDTLQVTTGSWKTDFSKHSVPLSEFQSGGPPRDGIPPIDAPKYVSQAEADAWLAPQEPVIAVTLEQPDGSVLARAYPLQIMVWHEIVNDTLGETPVAVTFCPLCYTAIAYDRRLEQVGTVFDFGTTGNLRHSDLVMWDRQTESWWQQFSGDAIVGELTGTHLTFLPAQIVGWQAFKTAYPAGDVLSRETGFDRSYGRNPYPGYDDVDSRPFLFDGTTDERLPPMERVVGVVLGRMLLPTPCQTWPPPAWSRTGSGMSTSSSSGRPAPARRSIAGRSPRAETSGKLASTGATWTNAS